MKVLKQRPDERLVIEAAQRDPARFAELYEDNFERVYAFVARRVYVRADAEDLTAEVFQQALAKLSGFEWRGVPRAAREQGSPIADDPPDPHSGANPEEIERTAQLFRLVKTLPDDQRRVIEMRFAEEKSIREIAKALKRTAGAVKQLQFRGIQKLRDQVSMESGTRPGGRNG